MRLTTPDDLPCFVLALLQILFRQIDDAWRFGVTPLVPCQQFAVTAIM